MWFLVVLGIMISVYVAKNEKVSEDSRNGWFVVVGIFLVLWIVLSVLF